MIYHTGDIVKIKNDAPLSGNTVAPPVIIGDEYPVEHIVTDRKGNQHLDLGLKSEHNYVTSWETGEELPDGDKIHWVHPSRVELIIKTPQTS